MISIDDFKKCDIRLGTILSSEKVPEADRLIKLTIDAGEETPRQIVSGIAAYYSDPSVLVGKQVPILMNLEPRVIKGIESKGMVLYAVGGSELKTLEPEEKLPNGTPVR